MDFDLEKVLPVKDPPDGMGVHEGDYQQDGLWCCGKCHERKQKRIHFMGNDRIVWCLCLCERQELAKEQEEDKKRDEFLAIERLRQASLMPGKFRNITFADYKVRPENQKAYRIATAYVRQFAQNEKASCGLLLYGPVGTGKSFTAACIANTLLSQGISVIMTSFVKILQDIGPGSGMDEGSYIQGLNKARLLIIDDLGAERSTDYAQEKVYNIIDSRVRVNKPMILTTNLKMGEMLECTDMKFKRIYDRIFEVCLPVEMNGSSFRMEHAAVRQEAMRKFFERTVAQTE